MNDKFITLKDVVRIYIITKWYCGKQTRKQLGVLGAYFPGFMVLRVFGPLYQISSATTISILSGSEPTHNKSS